LGRDFHEIKNNLEKKYENPSKALPKYPPQKWKS